MLTRQREFAALKGRLGSRCYFCKSNQRGSLGLPFFSGKPGKSAFRFTKSIKGTFFCSFCFCKKNQKAAVRVATLPTPGERFKALHRRTFYRNCSFPCLNQLSGFEPVRKGSCTLDARTRQKLPVASFGVPETAETGSIVSGCEQDDHVSRRLSLNIQILTLVG